MQNTLLKASLATLLLSIPTASQCQSLGACMGTAHPEGHSITCCQPLPTQEICAAIESAGITMPQFYPGKQCQGQPNCWGD